MIPLLLARGQHAPQVAYQSWESYGGGPKNLHYSFLDQINLSNVRRLKVAWTYDSGDAFTDSEMECNPIIVHGILYATTPKVRLIALDAATGKLRWSFDPHQGQEVKTKLRNRGVTYWEKGNDRRIFFVAEQYLYAIDAGTGKLVRSFGDNGRIDLRKGLGRDPEKQSVSATSPGVVYKDLLIMGSLVAEDLPASPGDIRAYDARTGKTRWTFHTIPHPGEPGYNTWPKDAWKYIGGVNDWAGMSVDEKRGLLFAATGSAAFDFYGANRKGRNLYANCLLALQAETGKLVWSFQGVRHDVWDRDFPAAPVLITVMRDGRPVDAVAQITKSGFVFVFNRETGQPLFPIVYRQVAPSDVDGERLAKTQVFPLLPLPFARQQFTPDLVTDRTPAAHRAVLAELAKLRTGPQFTPPSLQGTVIFPGFDGGGEWGGPAFDPQTAILYVNSNEMAWILRLVLRPKLQTHTSARRVYAAHCASCHHQDMTGSPPEFPSLVGIGRKFSESQIASIVQGGRGRMPAFSRLGNNAARALARYLATGKDANVTLAAGQQLHHPLKYSMDGYNKFLDPDGYPAVKPPWGTLNAINLNTGKYVWKIPLGEYPKLAAKGMRETGCENYGGPLVTAGGLLFIGATIRDRKFRAYDKTTGKLLWQATLPDAGSATPATYEVNGRQFVVIAAGGGKWGAPSGGSYVAFALP
ncbi:MAG: PQQ-binding-like beta-propeller repeat protein [Terriglobia bacterium]